MDFLRRLSLPGSSASSTAPKSPKPTRHDLPSINTTSPSPPQSPKLSSSPVGSPTTPRAPSPADLEAAHIKRTDNRLRRLSLILRRATSRRTRSGDQSSLGIATAGGDSSDAAVSATVVSRFPVLGTTSEEPEDEAETPEGELGNTLLADSQWVKSTISVFSLEQPHVFETFYQLLEPLGSGNFSTVYRARRACDGVIFAVKKVNKNVLNGKEDLIRAEIDIHSALDHPNIIKVVEVFETPEEWNIVLQLADGGELFGFLVENGAQGERRGKELARSILKGIAFFHKKGVVHRDLKPENILLHEQYSTEVYIADFGLSTRIAPGEVLTKQCGSLEYAAPELLAGKGYNTKADMWSAGVVIFTLIAGYQPFQSREDSRLLRSIVTGKYDFHESHWGGISDDCKDLVRRLLTVDPKKRLSAEEALNHRWFKN